MSKSSTVNGIKAPAFRFCTLSHTALALYDAVLFVCIFAVCVLAGFSLTDYVVISSPVHPFPISCHD